MITCQARGAMGFHDQVWMFLVRRNLKLPPPQSWVKAGAMFFFFHVQAEGVRRGFRRLPSKCKPRIS